MHFYSHANLSCSNKGKKRGKKRIEKTMRSCSNVIFCLVCSVQMIDSTNRPAIFNLVFFFPILFEVEMVM